jgi:hypothetical protein
MHQSCCTCSSLHDKQNSHIYHRVNKIDVALFEMGTQRSKMNDFEACKVVVDGGSAGSAGRSVAFVTLLLSQ